MLQLQPLSLCGKWRNIMADQFWLAFALRRDINLNEKAELIDAFGSAEDVYHADERGFNLKLADEVLKVCREEGITVITIDDPDYPVRLKNIFAPPYALYVKGQLPKVDDYVTISVIGTRSASPYGLKMGRNIAFELGSCGCCIVSGLTAGIDAAAAEGALASGCPIIGVLGTSVDVPGKEIVRQVAQHGCLISEYEPGFVPNRSCFRARNRIAAGLSNGVVAVEAPEKSGTRLFVAEALEQGKEIFALPGNADSENSAGTLLFLKEGAKLVTHGWEVAEEFIGQSKFLNAAIHLEFTGTEKTGKTDRIAPERKKPTIKKRVDKKNDDRYIGVTETYKSVSKEESAILLAIETGHHSLDEIVEAVGLPAGVVLTKLTMLQINGVVKKDVCGVFLNNGQ